MTKSLRILITGATGCLGSHLSELALRRGAEVFGFARRRALVDGVTGWQGDITQPGDIEDCLNGCRPEWIFHLAGLIPGTRNATPDEMFRVNLKGTEQLLESVRQVVPAARVFVAGSSGIYGQPLDPDQPIAETAPLQPESPYARSKAAQDQVASRFFLEEGLHTVRGRIFNQTGPREPHSLVCATLARQIAMMEAGLQELVLPVITLRSSRDFCDVRDVAAGCWAALEHGTAGEAYNICSGNSHTIERVIEILLEKTKLKEVRIIESHPKAAGQSITRQVGDPARLKACSGWKPCISLEQSLGDLLDEWRLQVRSEV